MTDISKEAVEEIAEHFESQRNLASKWGDQYAMNLAEKRRDMTLALLARVDELEAERARRLQQAIEEVSDAAQRGYLRGLDAAISVCDDERDKRGGTKATDGLWTARTRIQSIKQEAQDND